MYFRSLFNDIDLDFVTFPFLLYLYEEIILKYNVHYQRNFNYKLQRYYRN